MGSTLHGKGMWIWQVERCEGGDADAIVARAGEAGFTHLIIKIGYGTSARNGDLSTLVDRIRQTGISPWAWHYTHGGSPQSEADAGAARFREYPFDGFVVDAEREYEGEPKAAKRYMLRLRELLGGVPVALSSFYLPDKHPSFPWTEFLDLCDINMPQVYWGNADAVTCLEQSVAQNARFGKPIIPTGAASPDTGKAAGIAPFAARVREMGLAAVNFWDWEEADAPRWRPIADLEWRTPRVVVAVRPVGTADWQYKPVDSGFRDGKFWVRPCDLATAVGTSSDGTQTIPLREAVTALGLEAEYVSKHVSDPDDPKLYLFVHDAPAPGSYAVVFVTPGDGASISGVVPVKVRVRGGSPVPDTAGVLLQVKTPEGAWAAKGWVPRPQEGAADFLFTPGWDTAGTKSGPNGIKAVLQETKLGKTLAEAEIRVVVAKPGAELAMVANGAEHKGFITQSTTTGGPLGEKTGYCRAYAAECLAEFYIPNGRPNKRHSQPYFAYSNTDLVGDDAEEWARGLRNGVDSHRGHWLERATVYPAGLAPGDMVFWIDGLNGYHGLHGHVAIVVSVNTDGVIVSENSSSRGIGTHAISQDALSHMVGVMRWHR